MAYRFFATCSRGSEDLLAGELRALGAKKIAQARGGVYFVGALAAGERACLWLRTAQRVLLPLAESDAADADALYAFARTIGWQDHLTPQTTFAVEATVKSSAITHSHFAALRVKDAICDVLRERLGARPDVDAKNPDVSVVLHLSSNHASLALDLAGEALSRRGYRVSPTPAPLKETLAAALVLDAGWVGERPLHDPLTGSGTIAIEAALFALRRAPGRRRAMAFLRWPALAATSRSDWTRLCEEADALALTKLPAPVTCADFNEDAVAAARANVRAAGLEGHVTVRKEDVRRMPPLDPCGALVMNPPYAERLGQPLQVLGFYRQIDEVFATSPGATATVLATGLWAQAVTRRPLRVREVMNGPISARVFHYTL